MSEMKRGWRKRKIYEMVKKRERISIREIVDSTEINYNTIRSNLIQLTNAGLVERIGRGEYRHKSE